MGQKIKGTLIKLFEENIPISLQGCAASELKCTEQVDGSCYFKIHEVLKHYWMVSELGDK